MMNKRIIVITCGRKKESVTRELVDIFLNKLSESISSDIDVDIINIKEKNIKSCQGCQKCFYSGKCCITDDDMEELKIRLIESDIVIFANPVYINHIPGDFKNFLDRIAYWTHLFKLAGKIGTIIVSTSNSGVDAVASYLKEIYVYLGIVCTGIVNYTAARPQFKSLENEVSKLREYLVKNKKIEASDIMNLTFKSYQSMMNDNNFSEAEYRYWKDNGMLNMDSVQEIIDVKST